MYTHTHGASSQHQTFCTVRRGSKPTLLFSRKAPGADEKKEDQEDGDAKEAFGQMDLGNYQKKGGPNIDPNMSSYAMALIIGTPKKGP